jgi:hypothetical protein
MDENGAAFTVTQEHTVRLQKAETPMLSTPALFLFYIVSFQSIHSIRRKSL